MNGNLGVKLDESDVLSLLIWRHKWLLNRIYEINRAKSKGGTCSGQSLGWICVKDLFKISYLNLRFLLYLCSLDWLVIDWSVWLNRRLFYFNLLFVDLFSFSSCSWLWSWRLKAWRKWLWLCCRNYQRFRLLTFINRNLNGLLVAIDLMVRVLVSLAFTAQKVRLCTSEEVFTESARF